MLYSFISVSIYTPFLDEVCTKVGAVEASGFMKNQAENGGRNAGHYAPLSEFTSGWPSQQPRENQWYGDLSIPQPGLRSMQQNPYQQSNGTSSGRPPPPPYGSAGTAGICFYQFIRRIHMNEVEYFGGRALRSHYKHKI